jgi:hypothetical protein
MGEINKILGGQGENYKPVIEDKQYPKGYVVPDITGEVVKMRNNMQTYTGVESTDPTKQEAMNDQPLGGDDDDADGDEAQQPGEGDGK